MRLADAVVPRDWETGMQCTAMQWEYAVLVMQHAVCGEISSNHFTADLLENQPVKGF